MYQQNSSIYFILVIIISWHASADQLDPIEELIFKLNPRIGGKTTFETALTVQEKCNNDVKNAGDMSLKFPSPTPNDVTYNSSGFRKYGDKCNLEEERQFYKELLDILKLKTKDIPELEKYSNLELSPQYRFEQWSQHWKTWQANNRSFQVCNPRWLLECGKSEGEDECVCLSKGLTGLHYTIGLEVEKLRNNACSDDGKCRGDSSGSSENAFRCVAKVLEISASDNDEETVSGCEITLPVFGICQIDCNLGNACTILDPSRLNDKNEKFKNRKVCCSVADGCLIEKGKNSAPTIKATEVWRVLLYSFMGWMIVVG